MKDEIKTFYAINRSEWRSWLEENHNAQQSVRLLIYKKESKTPSVYYPEAVEEALCFGWIDNKANKNDENSFYLTFSKRKPESNWSKLNKERVDRLIKDNQMRPAGLKMIELAKQNGNWNALDEVENLTLPPDLQKAFNKNKKAFSNWTKFSASSRKLILTGILNAKCPETKARKIEETVRMAAENRIK